MEWNDKYNSFNSLKVLKHVDYWSPIIDGIVPPPIMVNLDCFNFCNFSCPHCNAKEKLEDKDIMSKDIMDKIIKLLSDWQTKTVCVGGGGESSLNKNLGYLYKCLNDNNIKIGMVTNAANINNLIECAKFCEWIGVSIDASTEETFRKMKGVDNQFDNVIDNVKQLISLNGPEITYKYLLHPDNIDDVYGAIKMAKTMGCVSIHIRPGGYAWFEDPKDNKFIFTDAQIERVINDIDNARELFEDKNFKVFGITHKFTNDWSAKHNFKKCNAIFTNCVIYSNGEIGLCCDRRGDDNLTLGHIDNIYEVWGSEKHLRMIDNINVSKCTRCTYSHINEIFENVILNDKMKCDFI